jgi:putative ABC transport system permease protein
MANELRYALRTLVKTPAFAAVAILTLALGIGANTAIFTVVNGVLLRPLPYPAPEQLVTLKSQQSAPELADIAEQTRSFSAIGGIAKQAADYAGGGEPQQLQVGLVAGEFFRVFGVEAVLGRTIAAADKEPVLVLSHALWQQQFGGTRDVLGRTIAVAGQSYTVIGVTPAEFRNPRGDFDAYVPLYVFNPLAAEARGAHMLRTYARLQPGITITAAEAELRLLDARMAEAYPDENKGRQTTVLSLQERMTGDVRPALLVLFGAVALLLLIACANFANLLLVRVESQRAELAIRSALGAGRGRLIRQVLIDSCLLAVLGGIAGLLLGSWGVDALLALRPDNLPRVENISVDVRVLTFTLALALLTGLLFGFVPAWQATRVQKLPFATASRTATAGRSPLQNGLVVAELSLALVLLIGAGLLGKAFWRLTSVAPGFEPANVVTARVELPEARYKTVELQTRFREAVLEQLNSSPNVRAAMVSELPLSGSSLNHNFVIEGRPPVAAGEEPELYSRSVAGDYFRVMGIPLLRGRNLERTDRADAPLVGVINETMARQYFGEQEPIGSRIRWARDETVNWIEIVGVVANVRHFGLAQQEEAAIYTPFAQAPQEWKRWSEIVVRTAAAADVSQVTGMVKQAIWSVDPLIPVKQVRTMNEIMAESLAERRFQMLLLGAFAGVALLLASVGLYGVLAFSVAQRTREIGIRVALGARAGDVIRVVLRHGLTLAAIGVAAGILISAAGTRLLARFLYGVTPTDPATFTALAVLLLIVAAIACVIPTLRALRVDPVVALRQE